MTYSFLNDYSENTHSDIIDALQKTQKQQFTGYSEDTQVVQLRQFVHKQLNNTDIAVHFCMTGTQANLVCIAAMLLPIEGIIACTTAHIVANETGAIEATGHKIILAEPKDGKLTVEAINALRQRHTFQPHVVRAKAIYISNATELGTVYTLAELKALYRYCQAHDMYVFMDGARLAAALASEYQDATLADIAKYTDIFWLGGTKMGAMFGEMIIITNADIAKDFPMYLKQHGGLMAKGYLLALQFDTLLKDDLYLSISRHANAMAQRLATGIVENGFDLAIPAQSNQVFAILPNEVIKQLEANFRFYTWEALNHNRSVVRLVTSWATQEAQVEKFVSQLRTLAG